MTIINIKLKDLIAHPKNVRTGSDKKEDESLKASIKAHGLLQGLVVTEAGKGKYKVVAGNRRLSALQSLVEEKSRKEDFEVPCMIILEEDAVEVSTAENLMRSDMHPADEYEAFRYMIEVDKANITQVANRFGKTELDVQKRMALGKLHPDLLKAFRADKIELQALMAFTLCNDQKKQLSVFKSLNNWEKDNPRAIREKLLNKSVTPDDKRVKFVGLEAYEKAGGKITADLFSENKFLDDSVLLEKLYSEKMNKKIEGLKAEGYAEVEMKPENYYTKPSKYTELDKAPKSAAEKAKVTVWVGFDYNDKLEITYLKSKKAEKKTAGKSDKKDMGGMSQALTLDMKLERLGAMQMALVDSPSAVELLFFQVSKDCFSHNPHGTDIRVHRHLAKASSAAAKLFDAKLKALPLEWLKEKTEREQFIAFMNLNGADKLKIVSAVTACCLDASLLNPKDSSSCEHAIAMSKVRAHTLWRPNQENYFSRITKDQLLGIGKAVSEDPAAWLKQHQSFKRSSLIEVLDKMFKDTAKNPKAATWLPEGMDFQSLTDSKEKKAA